jgi:hypothetical protein
MKIVELIYERRGTRDSAYPYWTLSEFGADDVDLSETVDVCILGDGGLTAPRPRWHVERVEVPDWLGADEVRREPKAWQGIFAALGVDIPESWGRGLTALSRRNPGAAEIALTLLRTRRFRSQFRAAMRDRLVSWLESGDYNREPWTPRQLAALAPYRPY